MSQSSLISVIATFALVGASNVSGQETPQPTASPAPTRPQLNIPDIPLAVEPPTLVPGNTVAPERSSALPSTSKNPPAFPLPQLDAAFQQSSLGQAAQEERLHLEWRQLQNRVAQNPDILAAKEAATKARTDFEKRERLRTYYNLYYNRMQALASTPQVKAYLEGKKNAALAALAQSRVRPDPTPGQRSAR